MAKKLTKTLVWLTGFLFIIVACKESYVMPQLTGASNLLVVEGGLNTTDTTKIYLSRSSDIIKNVNTKAELGAKVTIEGENGHSFSLSDNKNGVYTLLPNTITTSQKYRLKILTSNNKVYASAYVPIINSPQFDIGWQRDASGVSIYVNTRDATNQSRYYRWEYEETWKFETSYISVLEWASKLPSDYRVRDVNPIKYPYYNTCWRSEKSNGILLESTTALSEDVVNKKVLSFIISGSQKLSSQYSILIKQYVLSKDAFNYWENIRKNSNDLGSIFSPQPSEIAGNLTCITDPSIPVIGYFEACNITKKRVFIKNSEVPGWRYNPGCILEDVANNPDSLAVFGTWTPIQYGNVKNSRVFMSPMQCADCSITGSPTKPAFWP